jgi:hypothetical protein
MNAFKHSITLGLTPLKLETLIPPTPLKREEFGKPLLRELGNLFCVSPELNRSYRCRNLNK